MSEDGKLKFHKRLRLTRSRDFQRLYKSGRRARTSHFTVFFSPNHLGYSRFGFTVSKKLGSAVCRNRIKRIFREALRRHVGKTMTGFDFVFNPHQSAAALKSTVLAEDLKIVLSRLRGKYDASIDLERD